MDASEKTLPKRSITQDNLLVNAAYEMTLQEKRVLNLGISKIDPTSPPNKSEPYKFSISISEWADYFPGNPRNAYREMREACDRLMTRQVVIRKDTSTVKAEQRPEKDVKMQWVDNCEYQPGEGRLTIQFGYRVSLYLSGMFDNFTKYNLRNSGRLNTFYAIRIYEMLCQFRKEQRKTYARVQPVDELRTILKLDNAYKKFYDLKKWVIEPSINQINNKTDINVYLETRKTGRSVTGVVFKFHE